MTLMRASHALFGVPSPTSALVAAALVLGAGCSAKPPSTVPDSGISGPLPDDCHSAANALANADCQLTVGTAKTAYINPSGDREWFHLTLPSPLPDRPLLTVQAGMVTAPSSPVTLNVNVFKSDGVTSLGLTTDPKPHGEPTTFGTTISLAGLSGDLYFLIYDDPGDDSGGIAFDKKHPFSITVNTESDPDTASHTIAGATPIPLTGGAGQGLGVLSTTGDTDYFTVTVPQGVARPILYLDISAPALVPPPQARLQFTVYPASDAGAPLAAVNVASPSGIQEAATAVLLPADGDYLIKVNGYQPDPNAPPIPGNLGLAYTLKALVIPDLDANEPNDTPATATAVNMTTLGQSISHDGRIAYVPDPDWYSITIPAEAQNSLLKYQVSYNNGAPNNARYPPIAFNNGQPNVNTLQLTVGVPYLPPGMDATALCQSHCPGDPNIFQVTCQG